MRRSAAAVVVLALFLAAVPAGAAEPSSPLPTTTLAQAGGSLFKCERDGRVSYSDKPCDDGRLSIIEVAPGPVNDGRRPESAMGATFERRRSTRPTAGAAGMAPRAAGSDMEPLSTAAEADREAICAHLRRQRLVAFQNSRSAERGAVDQRLYQDLDRLRGQMRYYRCG